MITWVLCELVTMHLIHLIICYMRCHFKIFVNLNLTSTVSCYLQDITIIIVITVIIIKITVVNIILIVQSESLSLSAATISVGNKYYKIDMKVKRACDTILQGLHEP